MPVVTLSHRFDVSPSELFAILAAVERQPDWNPATLSARALDRGPVHVGSRFALELRGLGGYEVEVTELVPGQRLRLSSRMGSHSYVLRADGSGTQLDQVLELRLAGLRALLSPLMSFLLRGNLRGATAALGRYLQEQAVGATFAPRARG